MKGLIIKDLNNLKEAFKSVIIFMVPLIIFCIVMKIYFIYGFIIITLSAMVISTVTNDEMAKWDAYALTMPVTRRAVVASKYLLFIILTSIGGIILMTSILASFLYHNDINLTEAELSVLLMLLLSILLDSTLIPLIFSFGFVKGRFVLFLGGILPCGLIMTLSTLIGLEQVVWMNWLERYLNISMLLIGIIFISCVYMYCSYRIAVMIYEKKEF
ncbi:ABC-2 transporter permease [Eubacteriaceae bacterium ES2]|nr:ABC-2 transporter permease [Eubacteriaceae bacterium ES2]